MRAFKSFRAQGRFPAVSPVTGSLGFRRGVSCKDPTPESEDLVETMWWWIDYVKVALCRFICMILLRKVVGKCFVAVLLFSSPIWTWDFLRGRLLLGTSPLDQTK